MARKKNKRNFYALILGDRRGDKIEITLVAFPSDKARRETIMKWDALHPRSEVKIVAIPAEEARRHMKRTD